MKPTTIYTKRNIDTSNYVNTLTGETLFSEFSNTTSEYIIIDSNAFRYIQTIFSAQLTWLKYNVSQTWLKALTTFSTIKTE